VTCLKKTFWPAQLDSTLNEYTTQKILKVNLIGRYSIVKNAKKLRLKFPFRYRSIVKTEKITLHRKKQLKVKILASYALSQS